jgi:hypothetical protein
VQAETTRTRFRRSCGFSWDRSVIATAPHCSNCWGRALWTGGIPDDPKLKPQFRPRLFGLQHRCCAVRGPVLHLRVPYFRPTFTAGETFGPTEAASLRFRWRAQGLLDSVCGVVNRVLLRRRHACFGLTIVQMHGPSPPGWAGCLDDVILDTLVFHVENNGPREQKFLSGLGLKSKTGHCETQIRSPSPLTACLLWVISRS